MEDKNQWKAFNEDKPEYGQIVVCVSEAYENYEGEITRNVEVGCFCEHEWNLNPDTNEYEKEVNPHFEEVGTGYFMLDPEFWLPLPDIPEEMVNKTKQ